MMKSPLTLAALISVTAVGCASVDAADLQTLPRAALEPLMVGSTHYIDVGKPVEAVIYYETSKKAHMFFPSGKTVEGAWRYTDTGYFVNWKDGPEGDWRIAFEPGRLVYLDGDGSERGDITRISPGDAHGFTN